MKFKSCKIKPLDNTSKLLKKSFEEILGVNKAAESNDDAEIKCDEFYKFSKPFKLNK